MINEGVVDITPEEEKAIDSFLKDLEKYHVRRMRIHKDASDDAICSSLKDYANEILAPKYGLNNVGWRFFPGKKDNQKAASYSAEHKEIWINLYYSVGNPSFPLAQQKIDFKKMSVSVYHEWTHFKQDLLYSKATGSPLTPDKMYAGKKYHDTPEEQMAFARGELEWIKRNVKKTNPQEIIKWLKKWGVVQHESLSSLKKTNYKAYKRILKYLVLFVLKKQAQEELSKEKNKKKVK